MIIINKNTVSKPCYETCNNHSGHVDKNVFYTLCFAVHIMSCMKNQRVEIFTHVEDPTNTHMKPGFEIDLEAEF